VAIDHVERMFERVLEEATVRASQVKAIAIWAVVVFGCFAGQHWLEQRAAAQTRSAAAGPQAPRFEVDPMWPRPLPNHWILGSAIGVWVDTRDHVWIVHRGAATLNANENAAGGNPPLSKLCCSAAPPVLEFDAAGALVQSWGGPGPDYEWPQSLHGIFVETSGTVWIAANGADDGQVLKFARDGKFIKQVGFGWANAGSNDRWAFRQPAKVFVDEASKEAYVADGYGNKRVAVIDTETGAFKRIWGAYGNKPDDTDLGRYRPGAPPAQQFRNPVHCADLSKDRFVYVCDRVNNRIQVFTAEGKFVKEGFVEKDTLGSGSAWDLAFSKDPQQKYLFLADGMNQRVHVLERESLQVLTSFGDGGRQPGQFFGVHSIAVDSKGNIYTTETWEGKRLQRFVFKGVAAVPNTSQGTVWPKPAATK
jgi:DNA-binding beta-propeller fold protein YncE